MFNKICSTWAACSGVSTPTLTWSVRMTLILAPFSSARSYSRDSVCSRGVGSQRT